jgi:hypothetical protein
MIKEVTMYTVICDNCGKDVMEDQEYAGWNDKDFAELEATESDWIKEKDNHYCNDCYFYDDEDELRLDELRTKPTP